MQGGDDKSGDGDTPAEEPKSPIPAIRPGNETNAFGYPFQYYDRYDFERNNWVAFLAGANSTHYAPNASVCFENGLGLVQYDWELLIIKYMYGEVRENILNTTLFMRNVSDIMYVCLDAGENLYVFSQYKYDLFGRDNTNLLLGSLQNFLGSILTINKIYGKIMEHYEKNETMFMYFEFGRIFRLLLDIKPVVLEDAGNPMDDPNFNYNDTRALAGPPVVWSTHQVLKTPD